MVFDAKKLKADLLAAGIEVYRARPDEIQVAERIRLHIMDSGVRVQLGDPSRDDPRLRVSFTVRSQRSDFPQHAPETMLARARDGVGRDAEARGYGETRAGSVEVKDPMDATRVLDVWHELTYEKPAPDDADAAWVVDEVRWALSLERFLGRGDD